jgi:RimJ/RimL family protein N-acetyltransferase
MTTHLESDAVVAPERIVLRPVTGADSAAYRRLRQHVLDIGEGRFYSSSYTDEQKLTTEDHWRDWLTESPVRCTIGSFIDGELIGVIRAACYGDPSNRVAEFGASWIPRKYRRSGLARRGRDKAREWALEHGYRYGVIDIRSDNTPMQDTRKKEGAVYVYTKRNVTWADGTTDDAHYFMEDLVLGAEATRSLDRAIAFCEAALALLKHEQHEA